MDTIHREAGSTVMATFGATRITRKDGATLSMEIHQPAQGFATFFMKEANGTVRRAGRACGKVQILRVIRRWNANEIDHLFPAQTGDLRTDFQPVNLSA